MSARPVSLILAAGLLILIGLSGMAAGGSLLSLVPDSAGMTSDVRAAGLTIGTVIAAYGLVSVFAGVALLMLRRWAWRIGMMVAMLGLVVLVVALVASGPDVAVLFGIAVWGATLACLVSQDTRRAVLLPPPPRPPAG